MNSKFIKSVFIGDYLYIYGRVLGKEKEHGKTRIKLDLWIDNARGETTTVATASVLASSST